MVKKIVGLIKKILGLNKQFMLDFNKMYVKWGMNISGVLVIGAHFFREREMYENKGIRKFILFEPGEKAFNILRHKFGSNPDYELFNEACGSGIETKTLYTEEANDGQSNSLLVPDRHLKLHKDILFKGRESVQVVPLDHKILNKAFNFMSLDVQGYELEVLKGAVETLKKIDYILAEVNQVGASVYKGATNIDELSVFLFKQGFTRVEEPKWIKNSYGDSLWIRRTKLKFMKCN